MGSTQMHSSLCSSQFKTLIVKSSLEKAQLTKMAAGCIALAKVPRTRMLIAHGLGYKILRSTTSNVSLARDMEVLNTLMQE